MNSTQVRDALLSWLDAVDPTSWLILNELAAKLEVSRRPVLRPHLEASFGPTDNVLTLQRLRLDSALEVLTKIEVACQVGTLTTEEALRSLPPQIVADLKKLFRSQAFLRYCNAYTYFGIRFLAGRIAPPPWLDVDFRSRLPRSSLADADAEVNARPFALVSPPPIQTSERTHASLAILVQDRRTPDVVAALNFLDDFVRDSRESGRFELWLRGLCSDAAADEALRFQRIAQGMVTWAATKAQFYLSLEPDSMIRLSMSEGGTTATPKYHPLTGWVATNPAVPRLALADMYWIARLLRAEVSANATITYSSTSWLNLLLGRSSLVAQPAVGLREAEDILRSVFDFVCDLIQNADEITDKRERRAYEPDSCPRLPEQTVEWRKNFDEELAAIQVQRRRRQYQDSADPDVSSRASVTTTDDARGDGWAERIKTGQQAHNLFGLALSGGGIRSATFNLGVLQALQECDLLHRIDYLSTVSGGGFIGSWLVGNVARTAHWLGRLTTWDESIAHLRRYSNYLAPRKGALAPDTWTMWASWARNAFLVQLTTVTWLAALLLAVIAGEKTFLRLGKLAQAPTLAIAAASPALFVLVHSFLHLGAQPFRWLPRSIAAFYFRPLPSKWIRSGAVLPVWISSVIVASTLWNEAIQRTRSIAAGSNVTITYGSLLLDAWKPWIVALILYGAALVVVGFVTLCRRRAHAIWISAAALTAFYLQVCGILRLFVEWAVAPTRFEWYAYVFGPPLVLSATTISLMLFIGFCGRNSDEPIREWWTRFGAWLGAYAVAFLALASAAVFGPKCVAALLDRGNTWINWATIATWVGAIVGGLVAGQSSQTTGNEKESSRSRQILARAAGILFVVGGVLAVAMAVHLVLLLAGTTMTLRQGLSDYWSALALTRESAALIALACTLLAGTLFSWCFEINIFGLNQFYRNRLVRCYLGATRWVPGVRRPVPFTKFDPHDDLKLSDLGGGFRGPFPIFNCALNLGGSRDLALHTRHSASFSLTPLRCGSSRSRVGYAPTIHGDQAFAGGVTLGQAVAISGAAASPNMGYNTSPLVAFLLTMFNVRLGWWFPNPGRAAWDRKGLEFSLYYLFKELFGSADENRYFVNVSDGGHFENLGVYELIRRRCKVILISDAECDQSLEFKSLGNLVRLCETDFGARIDIDVSSLRRQASDGRSRAHCAVGKITYSNGSLGYLIYVKASVTGDESIGVVQYQSAHATFPHETTADQFFAEAQFESYRSLGQHVVQNALRGCDTSEHPVEIAERLYNVWAADGFTNELFIKHTNALDVMWERMRQTSALHDFMTELWGVSRAGASAPPTMEEKCVGLELIQLMENAFLDLRLDDFWEHPDNRGWVLLLSSWARSPRFRAIWNETHRIFGIRFEYFCESRLGLPGDRPVIRR